MADVDISLAGSNGIGGDGHALEHYVGIGLDDAAVHVCTGISLVRIAYHVLGFSGRQTTGLPLDAGRKPSTTAPAQPRGNHLLYYFLGLHSGKHLGQGLVAIPTDIVIDLFRVDQASIAKRQQALFLEKADFAHFRYGRPLGWWRVHEFLDRSSLEHVLFDQVGNIFFVE